MSKWLTESVMSAPLGTLISWRTAGGPNFGTVIGSEADYLFAVTTVDRSLVLDPSEKLYLDVNFTAKLKAGVRGLPRLRIDVHKVPKNKAFRRGRLKGMQLKPYVRMVKTIYGPVKLGKTTKKTKAGTALEGVFA